jgi:hypothetical protein
VIDSDTGQDFDVDEEVAGCGFVVACQYFVGGISPIDITFKI